MKELLSYNKPNHDPGSSQVLIIKLGERSFGYAVSNQSGSDLHSLGYCSIDDDRTDLTALEEKYPVLAHSYYEVKIVFDLSRSLFMPYNEPVVENTMPLFNTLFGYDEPVVTVTENIPGWQLKNIYAVSATMFNWVKRKFPAAKYLHQYSVAILNLGTVTHEGKLLVDFRHNAFSAVAGKGNKVLLGKTFEYETPEDVLFYLLKICEQFSFSPKEVVVELSGLIEKESSLYKELYQYFLHIGFRDANWNVAGEHPAHFFTSFNDMIKCAS